MLKNVDKINHYVRFFNYIREGEFGTYTLIDNIIEDGFEEAVFNNCKECYDLDYVLVVKYKDNKNKYWGRINNKWVMYTNLQAYNKVFL